MAEQLSPLDAQVLGLFGGGKDIDTIVARTGQSHADVSQRLMQLTTMNRQRAQYLAREYVDSRRALLAPPPAPAPTAAPPKPPAAKARKAAPLPVDLTAVAAIVVDGASLVDKLEAAERSNVPKLVRLAKHVRDSLDELTEHAVVADRERVLKDTIEALGDQLAQARLELKTLGRPATPGRPANGGAGEDGPTVKQLRDFAKLRGLPCPPNGRIPGFILRDWEKAHADGLVSL